MATKKSDMDTKSKVSAKTVVVTPAAKGTLGIQVLHASNVAIPLVPVEISPEIVQLRSDFFAGKELAAGDLRKLVASAKLDDTNDNCNIC